MVNPKPRRAGPKVSAEYRAESGQNEVARAHERSQALQYRLGFLAAWCCRQLPPIVMPDARLGLREKPVEPLSPSADAGQGVGLSASDLYDGL